MHLSVLEGFSTKGNDCVTVICGQSYNHFTLVNYDRRGFIRLATGVYNQIGISLELVHCSWAFSTNNGLNAYLPFVSYHASNHYLQI